VSKQKPKVKGIVDKAEKKAGEKLSAGKKLATRPFDVRIDQCPNCERPHRGECDGAPTDDLKPGEKCVGFIEAPKGFHYDEDETHPAFGVIRASKIHGGDTPLVGSSVRHHTFVEFTLYTARRTRSLHHDDYTSAGGKIIAQWRVSPAQLFEMLTTMNTSGTPCTLKLYRDPETHEFIDAGDPPDDEQVTKNYKDIKKQTEKATAKMRILQKKVKARAEQGRPMGKKEMEQLAIDIGVAAQETDSNMPFIADTFHKSVRHMVKDAKGEIDSFVNAKVMQTGLKALKEAAPELPENTVKIIDVKVEDSDE
jgi:hypothetical protein